MKTKILLIVTSAAVALAALTLGSGIIGDDNATQASPELSIGVDVNPAGNTATSLGTIDSCIQVATGTTFDVDIYIADVTDLLGWEMVFNYQDSALSVENVNVKMLQDANPGSDIWDLSHPWSGDYFVSAADMKCEPRDPAACDSGSGVLARLTLRALESGVTPITLGGPILKDKDNKAIGDTNGDLYFDGFITSAWVAVNEQCPSDPPPTATPVPTLPPTATPVPTLPSTPSPGPPATVTPGPRLTPEATTTPGPTATPTPLPPAVAWRYFCYLGASQPTGDALADVTGDVLAAYSLRPDQTWGRWFSDRLELSNMTVVDPYEALFLLMDSDATWPQEPQGMPPESVNLGLGWNSVCYAGGSKDVEAATTDLDHLSALYTLASDQTWQRFIPGMPQVSNLVSLEPSTPALVLVTGEGGTVWVFDP